MLQAVAPAQYALSFIGSLIQPSSLLSFLSAGALATIAFSLAPPPFLLAHLLLLPFDFPLSS